MEEQRVSVSEAARTGDRLRTLEALREKLARAIDGTVEGTELSSLSLRLQRVLAEIADLGGQAKDEENDDLAARRDAKLRTATGS